MTTDCPWDYNAEHYPFNMLRLVLMVTLGNHERVRLLNMLIDYVDLGLVMSCYLCLKRTWFVTPCIGIFALISLLSIRGHAIWRVYITTTISCLIETFRRFFFQIQFLRFIFVGYCYVNSIFICFFHGLPFFVHLDFKLTTTYLNFSLYISSFF